MNIHWIILETVLLNEASNWKKKNEWVCVEKLKVQKVYKISYNIAKQCKT